MAVNTALYMLSKYVVTIFVIKDKCLQIDVQEEYKIYPLESFVADVGGYLGLLLGASILSLIESLTDTIEKLRSKHK